MLPDGVTFSAGVATSDGTAAPRTLIDAADQALYQAKANGRDRVVVGG
jgi:PleD family two-component response regulator